MAKLEPDRLFDDPIYGRQPRKEAIMNTYHNAMKLQQAVVTVKGYKKDLSSMKNLASYITRENDLPAFDSVGNKLNEKDLHEIVEDWVDEAKQYHGKRIAAHIILSAPKGANAKDAQKSAEAFGKKVFKNYDHFSVLHNDTDNPHVHMMVKVIGNDLKKIRIGKKELYSYRQQFAKELRSRGIQVTATSRASRGVKKKFRNPTADREIVARGEEIKHPPKRTENKTTVHPGYSKQALAIATGLSKQDNKTAQQMAEVIRNYGQELSGVAKMGATTNSREKEVER